MLGRPRPGRTAGLPATPARLVVPERVAVAIDEVGPRAPPPSAHDRPAQAARRRHHPPRSRGTARPSTSSSPALGARVWRRSAGSTWRAPGCCCARPTRGWRRGSPPPANAVEREYIGHRARARDGRADAARLVGAASTIDGQRLPGVRGARFARRRAARRTCRRCSPRAGTAKSAGCCAASATRSPACTASASAASRSTRSHPARGGLFPRKSWRARSQGILEGGRAHPTACRRPAGHGLEEALRETCSTDDVCRGARGSGVAGRGASRRAPGRTRRARESRLRGGPGRQPAAAVDAFDRPLHSLQHRSRRRAGCAALPDPADLQLRQSVRPLLEAAAAAELVQCQRRRPGELLRADPGRERRGRERREQRDRVAGPQRLLSARARRPTSAPSSAARSACSSGIPGTADRPSLYIVQASFVPNDPAPPIQLPLGTPYFNIGIPAGTYYVKVVASQRLRNQRALQRDRGHGPGQHAGPDAGSAGWPAAAPALRPRPRCSSSPPRPATSAS